MTNEEAKAAWREQKPVELDGATYTVRSLVYRYPKELLLELLDKHGNCVVIVPPEKVNGSEA